MSPIPNTSENAVPSGAIALQGEIVHHLLKRVNLNPFHFMTLPLKKNWGKVEPFLDKYNNSTRIIAVLLGGLSMIAMLDMRNWKLPRWPWAKDGQDNPPPSYRHENERYSADQLAEKMLMEMLEEMKMYDGKDEIPLAKSLPKDDKDEVIQEAKKQFIEDAGVGEGDIVGEMEVGVHLSQSQ
jgi:hypothetical protein